MNYLKLGLISVIVFAVILFLLSLLFPSQVFVTRAININLPAGAVIKKIQDIDHWPGWNPMVSNDSGQSVQFTEENGKPVFVMKQPGSSEEKRLLIDNKTASGVEYSFILSAHTEYGNIVVDSSTAGCEVRWTQWKKAKYPWQKFSFFFQDKIYAPMFEKGLEELKEQAEAGELRVKS